MMPGIVPGPQVMEQKPGLFWGVITSMWVGNLMLIVLNLRSSNLGCACCWCRTGCWHRDPVLLLHRRSTAEQFRQRGCCSSRSSVRSATSS